MLEEERSERKHELTEMLCIIILWNKTEVKAETLKNPQEL